MSKLKLRRLRIVSQTNEGRYGVDIPFVTGLNIIQAENTFGKSTCIQSIIYALGLEGTLGPSRKTPLKSALTSRLKKADGSYALISETKVFLEIENSRGAAITLIRSSIESKNRLISVYQGAPDNIENLPSSALTDYFVRDPGAAARDRGFHQLLEKFLGVIEPQVIKYDGSFSNLYLESIFAVNYVEQTRGWGGILNVLPTYLQIKELSSKIIEYNLNLDIQENNKKRQQLLIRQSDLESVWTISVERLVSLARQVQAFVSNNISDDISKQAAINSVSDIYFLDADSKEVSLDQYVENLKMDLEKIRSESKAIEIDSQKIPGLELELTFLMEKLSAEEAAFSILISDLDVSDDYIKSIDKRTASVRESLRKYRDVKKLQEYGSEEKFNFLEGICPTCNQPVEDSLLPHMHNQSALGVDDNIKYLEKQKIVFDSMKEGESKKLLMKKSLISHAQQKINATRAEIRSVKESLTDVKGAPSRAQLRKEIMLEERISSVDKAAALETEIKEKLASVISDWSTITGALKKLPWDGFSRNDNIKLNELLNSFKENLKDFDYKSTPIEEFEISKRTYKPAIDEVDLGSEASASDNIRVIWAYMYTLLILDSRLNGLTTNHLGLLMLDEPRQQETKEVNFKTFIEKAARTFELDKQVIIATSEKYDDLSKMIDGLQVNVVRFENPVISRIGL
ncbi:hypothetical protein [Pseudomonas umsongensis]|uniref:hypothetical protein n=1 Tax=Pseudomonas umsongensis TaxID=198618 RepID=UPI00200B3DA7|nr:hypothetical protein [Pseudomonas umsongensis]MCK8655824.1 hypothetical protein [Pseudomonas umsongensis]